MSVSSANAVLCRCCLSCCEGLRPLEGNGGSGGELSNKDMLLTFCNITFEDTSTSSCDLICKDCSLETLSAYNFKLKCEQSDVILKERAQCLKHESLQDVDSKIEVPLKAESVLGTAIKLESDIDLYNVNIKIEDADYGDDHGFDSEEYTPYVKKAKRKKQKKNDELSNDNVTKESRKRIKSSSKNSKKNKLSVNKRRKSESSNDDSDDLLEVLKNRGYLPKVPGRPGRRKKVKPLSELVFVDDSATTIGYKKIYECPKCHAFFKTFRMLHKHMIKLHQVTLKGVNHFNSMWEAKTAQEDEFKEEIDKSKVNPSLLNFEHPKYKCLDCSFMNKSFEGMKSHIISQHRGDRYIHCDECEYKTTHLTMFVRHKRMHSGERRFGCSECPYRTSSNYQLNLHIAAHHTEHKGFVCDVCAQAFKTKFSLLNHITRIHVNKREHLCTICSKGFNMKRDLKNHSLTHLGQRPHVCEHCGMAFTQKTNLEKHVQIIHVHSGERPFACSECSYRAKSVYSLKSHMYRHNRTQHYPCHLCTHKASTKYALKIHVQRHLGDKQHHCKSCSYSCYDSQTLVAHSRIHTGERPFPCDLCPYRSRTKQRLRNHMKSHLNEQKYSCQHCPYRSNYKSNLIVHLKKNCGRDSRPYTPRKNQAAINFSMVPNNADTSLIAPSVHLDDENMQHQMKTELNVIV